MHRLTANLSRLFLAGVVVLLTMAFLITAKASADPYAQIVDNSTKDRFKATGKWVTNTHSPDRYGKNYKIIKSGKSGAAMYKVRTPGKGYYTVPVC